MVRYRPRLPDCTADSRNCHPRTPAGFLWIDQSILCREGIIQFIQLCLFCGDFMVGCHGFCVSLSKLTLLAATIIKNKTAIFSTKATKTAVFGVSSVSVELQESLQFHTCGGIQQTFCRTILQYFPFLKKHRFISDSPCLLQGVGDQNQNTIGLAHIGLNQSFRAAVVSISMAAVGSSRITTSYVPIINLAIAMRAVSPPERRSAVYAPALSETVLSRGTPLSGYPCRPAGCFF